MQGNNQSAIAMDPPIEVLAPIGEGNAGLAAVLMWLPKDTPADVMDVLEESIAEFYSKVSGIISGKSSEE